MGITKQDGKLEKWFRYIIVCDGCGSEFSLMERRIDWLKKKLKDLGFKMTKKEQVTHCPKCRD